jgi:crossover junction endodeoxyribonuclease RuvC
MIYIGIDPGAKGAMAVIQDSDVAVIPFRSEDYIRYLEDIKHNYPCVCCIEEVHSMPKQGVSSTFALGRSYGWLLGMLDTIGVPYQLVKPQTWKKEFGLNSDKTKSIAVCKRLFPNVSLLRTERSRKEDDNLAEALLMATYAKRHF